MTDLHTRAVTLADADGTAPYVSRLHKLAIRCLATLEAPPPTVMYILRDGNGFQAQDYFAHCGPIPYIRADTIPNPTDAELDAAALARPVVRSLVKAATEFANAAMSGSDLGWPLVNLDEALAAAKGSTP